MENIKNNKKVIFICVILIILTMVIYFIISHGDKENIKSNLEDNSYLKKYNSNEYIPVYITEEDIIKKYLNEFKNNMLYDIEEAYNSLNKEYREKRFSNLEGYKEYLNKVISLSTYSMSIEKYSVDRINGYKVFNVYDDSGYQYIIKEISIMNYEVYLDQYTVEIK